MNKVILLGRMTRDAEVRRGESDSIFAMVFTCGRPQI